MTQEKICIQKFLPHHKHIIDKINQGNNPHLAAAFYTSKIWPAYTEIFVTFTEKDPQITRTPIVSMKTTNTPIDPLQTYFSNNPTIPIPKAIEKIVKERLEPLINIKFTFTDIDRAKNEANHVRVSFDPDGGSWSLVGTDAINQKSAPTMNLGWFDVSTVMHEFGHVLGLIHEHQNPKGQSIEWNDKAVYAWANQTQGWTKEETDTNILNKYSNDQINGSSFDPLSIMLYFFPASLTINHKGTTQNLRISGEDALWLNKTYPGSSETPRTYYPKVYNISLDKSLGQSKSILSGTKSWLWVYILVILTIGFIIGFLIWKKLKHSPVV
jgi:hypothetical protein